MSEAEIYEEATETPNIEMPLWHVTGSVKTNIRILEATFETASISLRNWSELFNMQGYIIVDKALNESNSKAI